MESLKHEGEVFYSAVPPSVVLSQCCLFFKQVDFRFDNNSGGISNVLKGCPACGLAPRR